MKKVKLLASLSAVGALGVGVATIASSCTWTYKGGNSSLDPKLEINIEDTTIALNEEGKLAVSVKYDGKEDAVEKITAESSDESIFVVESIDKSTGVVKIKGLAAGTAKLTITVVDTQGRVNKKTIDITVKNTQTSYSMSVSSSYATISGANYCTLGSIRLRKGNEPVAEQGQKFKLTLLTHNTNLSTADIGISEEFIIGEGGTGNYTLFLDVDREIYENLYEGTDTIEVSWVTPEGVTIYGDNNIDVIVRKSGIAFGETHLCSWEEGEYILNKNSAWDDAWVQVSYAGQSGVTFSIVSPSPAPDGVYFEEYDGEFYLHMDDRYVNSIDEITIKASTGEEFTFVISSPVATSKLNYDGNYAQITSDSVEKTRVGVADFYTSKAKLTGDWDKSNGYVVLQWTPIDCTPTAQIKDFDIVPEWNTSENRYNINIPAKTTFTSDNNGNYAVKIIWIQEDKTELTSVDYAFVEVNVPEKRYTATAEAAENFVPILFGADTDETVGYIHLKNDEGEPVAGQVDNLSIYKLDSTAYYSTDLKRSDFYFTETKTPGTYELKVRVNKNHSRDLSRGIAAVVNVKWDSKGGEIISSPDINVPIAPYYVEAFNNQQIAPVFSKSDKTWDRLFGYMRIRNNSEYVYGELDNIKFEFTTHNTGIDPKYIVKTAPGVTTSYNFYLEIDDHSVIEGLNTGIDYIQVYWESPIGASYPENLITIEVTD